MAKQGTILVVDDNKGILTAVQMLLGTCFEKVITISTPNKIKNTLHDENVDVVLLDMNFSAGINSGNEGLFWLSEIKKAYPSIQVVLFTAYADIDLAVRGIKEGATDFVVKPWDNAKLLETLRQQAVGIQGKRYVLGRQQRHATATDADRESSQDRRQYINHGRERNG